MSEGRADLTLVVLLWQHPTPEAQRVRSAFSTFNCLPGTAVGLGRSEKPLWLNFQMTRSAFLKMYFYSAPLRTLLWSLAVFLHLMTNPHKANTFYRGTCAKKKRGRIPLPPFFFFWGFLRILQGTVEYFNSISRFFLDFIYFSSVVHLNSMVPSVIICKVDLILFL